MSCQDISKEMSFDSSQWACEWDISFAQITHIHNGWHMSITTRTSHIFISRTSHISFLISIMNMCDDIMDETCLSQMAHKCAIDMFETCFFAHITHIHNGWEMPIAHVTQTYKTNVIWQLKSLISPIWNIETTNSFVLHSMCSMCPWKKQEK